MELETLRSDMIAAMKADKVHLMLLSTDTTKAPQERVARQTTKHGLYNALDIGSIWLQKANAQ